MIGRAEPKAHRLNDSHGFQLAIMGRDQRKPALMTLDPYPETG